MSDLEKLTEQIVQIKQESRKTEEELIAKIAEIPGSRWQRVTGTYTTGHGMENPEGYQVDYSGFRFQREDYYIELRRDKKGNACTLNFFEQDKKHPSLEKKGSEIDQLYQSVQEYFNNEVLRAKQERELKEKQDQLRLEQLELGKLKRILDKL